MQWKYKLSELLPGHIWIYNIAEDILGILTSENEDFFQQFFFWIIGMLPNVKTASHWNHIIYTMWIFQLLEKASFEQIVYVTKILVWLFYFGFGKQIQACEMACS